MKNGNFQSSQFFYGFERRKSFPSPSAFAGSLPEQLGFGSQRRISSFRVRLCVRIFPLPQPSLPPIFGKRKFFPPVPFFHALKVQKVFLPFWRKEKSLLVLIPWKWAFRAFSLLLRFSRCYVRYFVWKWTFLLLSSLIVLDIIIIIGLGGLTLLLSHRYCRHPIATDCLEMFRSELNSSKKLQNSSLDSIPPRQLRSGANELGDQDGTRRDRVKKSKHTKKRRRRHHSLFLHPKLEKKKRRRRQGRTVVFVTSFRRLFSSSLFS